MRRVLPLLLLLAACEDKAPPGLLPIPKPTAAESAVTPSAVPSASASAPLPHR